MLMALPDVHVDDPETAWAASGAMALTGRPEGPPLLAPPGVVAGLCRWSAAVEELGGVSVDGPALLSERAAVAGLSWGGDVSCGGATRLLMARDGWLAVTCPTG